MRWLYRHRPSPAMFVALLALLVALGGTATAGVLITGKQVKNGSLTGADVRNSSLTGKDVRNNSLTSKDVKNLKGTDIKNGSLTAADFAAGELPVGPAGPQGQPGPAGPVGPPGPLLDRLPSGATLRGVYDVTFTATAVSQFDTDAFNYGIPLASAPAANFVASGNTPPTPCTGTAAAPEAAPGHLCVYEASGSGYTGAVLVDPAINDTGAGAMGTRITLVSSGAGLTTSRGSWAVTAP